MPLAMDVTYSPEIHTSDGPPGALYSGGERQAKRRNGGTFLVTQWLRVLLAGDAGSIPGLGTRIPHATWPLGLPSATTAQRRALVQR